MKGPRGGARRTGAWLGEASRSGGEVELVGQAGGLEVGWLGPKAEVAEDSPDDVAGHDVGDVSEAAAAWARQGVDLKAALHELSPAVVAGRALSGLHGPIV